MDDAKRKGGEGGRQEGRHGGPVGGRLSLTTCCFCISSRRDHGPPFADCSRAPCAVDTLFSPGPAARSSIAPPCNASQPAGKAAGAPTRISSKNRRPCAHHFPSLRQTICRRIAGCSGLESQGRCNHRQRHLLGPVLPCKCSKCCIVPMRGAPQPRSSARSRAILRLQ